MKDKYFEKNLKKIANLKNFKIRKVNLLKKKPIEINNRVVTFYQTVE